MKLLTDILPSSLPNEHLRLQKLYSYDILQTPAENPFERITKLAAQLFNAPMAQLSFVAEDDTFVKSNIGLLDVNDSLREECLASISILDSDITFYNHKSNQEETFVHPFILKNNIAFYIAAPLITPEGYAMGTLSVLDFTRQEPNEQQQETLKSLASLVIEVLEMRAGLRLATHVQTDLTNKTVHDLKNPNTTISLSAELIKKKADDIEIVNNFADRIKSATHSILANIDHLMDISQLENGNFRLNIQEIDVLHLLQLTVHDFELRLQQKQMSIEINAKDATLLLGDAKRLQEAFAQLLSNAIKYSYPHSKIQISISKADEQALIEFKDEGQGLTETDMGKLFVKFAKLSASPSDREYSAGMGLSIARTLIELHKGKIWATSEGKDAGASFYIALPL